MIPPHRVTLRSWFAFTTNQVMIPPNAAMQASNSIPLYAGSGLIHALVPKTKNTLKILLTYVNNTNVARYSSSFKIRYLYVETCVYCVKVFPMG